MKKLFVLLLMIFVAAACTKEQKIVEKIGPLSVTGNQLTDKKGETVQLVGMSLFWSQIKGKYYNYDCIKWLRDDWNVTVVRAAMGVEKADDLDGYLVNPEKEKKKMFTVINACIDLGLYVVVDWHSHHAEASEEEAAKFFKEIATLYGDKPNIIYEIYNEPLQISWADTVKPYSQRLVDAIREIDPDNVILIGPTSWAQDVDVASLDQVKGNNLAYTLHFYASSHTADLRAKAETALNNGVALFVSEFGVCEYTGDGEIAETGNNEWFSFMEKHKLSWCNWAIGDKDESCASLVPGASAKGGWKDSDLTVAGKMIREKIRKANAKYFVK